MKRKLVIALALLVVCIGAASWWYVRAGAAAGEFPSEVLSLLPSDSSVVLYADMEALRGEPLVQRLIAMAPAIQHSADYEEFLSATGFNYERDLDRVFLASTAAPSPQVPAEHFVAIADGRFDQKKIEAYATQNAKVEQQNGHSVFTTSGVPKLGGATSSAFAGRPTAFTFVTATRIAIGNPGDVAALLASRPASTPNAALQEQVSRVSGSPIFVVAKSDAFLTKGNPMAAQFTALRWVNLAARPEGANVLLSAEGTCDNPDQARQLAASLELMRGLMRGMAGDPKNLGAAPPQAIKAVTDMLQGAQITSDQSRVRLLLSMDTAVLDAAPGASRP